LYTDYVNEYFSNNAEGAKNLIAGKKRLLFLSLLLITLALSGCAVSPGYNTNEQEMESASPTPVPGTDPDQEYVVYNGGSFKINYPISWVLEDQENYIVDVVFKAPERGDARDSFLPTVNVLIAESNDVKDFNEYIENVISNLKMNFLNFSMDEKQFKDDNTVVLTYIGTIGGYNVQCRQLIGLKGDRLYIVTYVSDQAIYDEYLDTAVRMMDSLEV